MRVEKLQYALRDEGFDTSYNMLRDRLHGKRSLKLAANVRLEMIGDMLVIVYHETDVVRWFSDGRIVLSSGGWRTKSTKEIINAVLPLGVRVTSGKEIWYVMTGHVKETSCLFVDGIEIMLANGIASVKI